MKIREVEVDFDFLDADNIEKFEKEVEKVQLQTAENQKKEMKLSETIRAECKVVKDFFDNIFGEGTSEKIFGSKNNLTDCINAFQDIVNAKLEQQKNIETTFARYSPNRAQRRAK